MLQAGTSVLLGSNLVGGTNQKSVAWKSLELIVCTAVVPTSDKYVFPAGRIVPGVEIGLRGKKGNHIGKEEDFWSADRNTAIS